jgi:hypothetical protein
VLIGQVDIGQRLPDGQVDIPHLKEGGMPAPFLAVCRGFEAVCRALDLRDALQVVFDRYILTRLRWQPRQARTNREIGKDRRGPDARRRPSDADDLAVLRIISGSASVPCRSRIFETATGPIHGEAAAQRGSRILANK